MSDGSAPEPRPSAPASLGLYDGMLDLIDGAASLVLMALMSVLTVVVVIQVVLRYGFNSSLDWGWEVPRLCFISMVFLAIPIGLKKGVHVGVELITERLPAELRRTLLRVSAGFIIAFLLVIVYHAAIVAGDTWDQLMPTLNLSTGVFYVVLIVGNLHAVLHLARIVWTGSAPLPESLSE